MKLIKDKISSSNFKFFSSPKSRIFNSKFSFSSLKFHILNAQFLNSKSLDFQLQIFKSCSNNNFHISNTLAHFSIYFFTHTYFKKIQKTLNNNSQNHLPNGLLFPKFQIAKISNFKFHIQNFKSQIFKIPSFKVSKFQVSNLSKSQI